MGVFAALNDDHAVTIVSWDKIFERILNTTNVNEENTSPEQLNLYQNYPNPFNPNTIIKYAIGKREYASLKVYDILGNEVVTLVNEINPAGIYEVEFNAEGLPSGIYFYQLKAGSFVETKKLTLLR